MTPQSHPDETRDISSNEANLESGPGRPAGDSVLNTLGAGLSSVPRVLLRDPDSVDHLPVVRPNSGQMPERHDNAGRLQLQGEIARGGMGAVLKGRDTDLGRDIAVKVLLEGHQGKPELMQRFVEEAQISGQLQHPGIAPVYELGQFADKRPFFTMKLVKGKTLSALLIARRGTGGPGALAGSSRPLAAGANNSSAERYPGSDTAGSPEDLPRFLAIFTQVCQTMAYAHARGVIHRDLKPSNIMVGAFGEVQVMDWGLAKVLPQGGVADERDARTRPQTSVIRTARSDPSDQPGSLGLLTQAGSVLGTPAYMAPEQARGDVDLVDERADVFGLGAILCEILTGEPPFTGKLAEAQRKAQTARLDDAFVRLDGCGADAELIALNKLCLGAEPWDRPRDARQVAHALAAYQESSAQRLRQAELERAAAEVQVVAERKRRRLALALVAAVLALVLAGGGSGTWFMHERFARLARVELALKEAELLRDQALADPDGDPAKWQAARHALRLGADLLGTSTAASRTRLEELTQEIEQGASKAEADRKLVARLDEIRTGMDADTQADSAYATAFRDHGLDLEKLDPAELGRRLASRPRGVAQAAVSALDAWALICRSLDGGKARAGGLLAAARAADPDPWRNRLRDALEKKDLDAFRRLTQEKALGDQGPVSLWLLGDSLEVLGDHERALDVLRQAQRKYPGDYWLNMELGTDLLEGKRVNPGTGSSITNLRTGFTEEKDGTVTKVRRSPPEESDHAARYQAAMPYLSAAVALRPHFAPAHHALARALAHQGKWDEAMLEDREAIRLQPDYAKAHRGLAHSLRAQGKLQDAIIEYREAIRIDPNYIIAHNGLGLTLLVQGKLEEAVGQFHEAIRINPNDAEAYSMLGSALRAQGKLDEAIAEYHAAIKLDGKSADAHNALGNVLRAQGKLDEAIAEYRAAIKLDTNDFWPHNNLGNVLHDQGNVLHDQGKLEEAIAEYNAAIKLDPRDFLPHNNLARVLYDQGKLDEAIAEYRAAISLDPNNASPHSGLGDSLRAKNKPEEAITQYLEAIKLDPGASGAHGGLGQVLANQGKLDEAINHFRAAIKLDGKDAWPHISLAFALIARDKLDEAIAECHDAIRLAPKHATPHYLLGLALQARGQFTEAVAAFRLAHELGSKQPNLPLPYEKGLRDAEQRAEAASHLPAYLQGEYHPASNADRLALIQVCQIKKLYLAAARLSSEAFAADPRLLENPRAAHRYNAACSAAQAGCGLAQDGKTLDEKERARWRQQALDWLHADLAAWTKYLETAPPEGRQGALQAVRHWQADPDLTGLRDPSALAKLPSDEQQACRKLWTDLAALLQKWAPRPPVNSR